MIRYLGLAWDSLNDANSTEAENLKNRIPVLGPTWESCINEPGLYVACQATELPSDRFILSDNCGVLIGPTFSGSSRHPTDPKILGHDLMRTAGRAAISLLWGSYVLFMRDRSTRTDYVMRSPMAQLPCFFATFQRVTIVFSSVDDLFELTPMTPAINWAVIRAQATNRDYLTRSTALQHVTSLECGECLVVAPKGTSLRVYWSPPMVARRERIADFEHATAMVSTLTRRCVSAWSSRYPNILHTLSGGLDSSIVLACLRRAPNGPTVTCLNQYSPEHIGDERLFARSMAAKWDVPLVEIPRNPNVQIERFMEVVRTVRPVLHFSGIDCYSTYLNQAHAAGATAIFNGELGDNVFGSVSGYEVVSQSLRECGISVPTLAVALDYALLRKRSVWSVLSSAARYNARRNSLGYWSMHDYMQQVFEDDPRNAGFISAEALADYRANIERHLHPWFLDIEGVPHSLFMLFFALFTVTSSSYHQPFAQTGDPPTVSPLVSQPLVDASLTIDAALHIRGGRDRAVAREAFKDDLSDLVLLRRGKGSPSGWIEEVVRRNRPYIREVLLNGVMVKERILDRAKLETALSAAAVNSPLRVTDIFLQLYIECWLRQWAHPKVRSASLASGGAAIRSASAHA